MAILCKTRFSCQLFY